MKLSLTSWSLRACSLPEAAGIARALGIGALDLGYFYGPALDKAALLADPDGMAETVRALGIHVPSFYHLFGDSLSDRNLADPRHRDRNIADFRKAVQFCARAEIDTIFILPGVCNPGQGRAQALEESARSLNAPGADRARGRGDADDRAACPFLPRDPGLGRGVAGPGRGAEADARLRPFRLPRLPAGGDRPAGPPRRACPSAPGPAGGAAGQGHEGTINIEAQLATLRDAGFQGHLALEYVHQDYMATLHDDVLTETIRMRDQVRGWLA